MHSNLLEIKKQVVKYFHSAANPLKSPAKSLIEIKLHPYRT